MLGGFSFPGTQGKPDNERILMKIPYNLIAFHAVFALHDSY
jgi:hypothetical protein